MKRILVLLLALGLACSAVQKKPGEPVPQEKKAEAVSVEAVETRSYHEVKKLITGATAYSAKGKTAFLSSEDKLAKKAETELLKIFDNAFTVENIGLSGLKPRDVLAQLDQRSVGTLVCFSSPSDGRLAVSVFSLENGGESEILLNCDFREEEKSGVSFIMDIATRPDSVVAGGASEFFVSDGKKTAVVNTDGKSERTVDAAVCETQKLYNFGEGVRIFCPENLRGGKFTAGDKGYQYVESQGFPLPEKASRFIRAEKGENGEMALLDKIDNVFGEFRLLVKTVSGQTTVFLALSPSGDIWGLRGDLIATVGEGLKGPFASIAASETLVCALGADGRLYKISMDRDFMLSQKEVELGLPGRAVNIAVHGNKLHVFVSTEKGVSLYSDEAAR